MKKDRGAGTSVYGRHDNGLVSREEESGKGKGERDLEFMFAGFSRGGGV